MPHPCAAPGCKILVSDRLLMCAADWRLVPLGIQRDVYRAYAKGAGIGTPELAEAHRRAIEAVAAAKARVA
ncbi:MAG: hypothetical protein ABSD03_12365 [Vulcanimicrobiaceae bacterium]|jgi:hypothetical protein